MPDITDPRAVRLTEQVRQFLGTLADVYDQAKALARQIDAKPDVIEALNLPADWRALEDVFALGGDPVRNSRVGAGIETFKNGDVARGLRTALWVIAQSEANGGYLINMAVRLREPK